MDNTYYIVVLMDSLRVRLATEKLFKYKGEAEKYASTICTSKFGQVLPIDLTQVVLATKAKLLPELSGKSE